MNKEQMLAMKKAYEANLVATLAPALMLKPEEIKAEWSLEKTVITITHVVDKATHYYTITAEDSNILLTMFGVKTYKGDNIMRALEVLPMSIDVATLNTIQELVLGVLTADPLAAPTEAVTE